MGRTRAGVLAARSERAMHLEDRPLGFGDRRGIHPVPRESGDTGAMRRGLAYFLTAAAFGPAWFVALRMWPRTSELFQSPGLLVSVASPLRPAVALTVTSMLVAALLWSTLRSGSRRSLLIAGVCSLWGAAALFVPVWMLIELGWGKSAKEGLLLTLGGLVAGAVMGGTVGTAWSLPLSLVLGAAEFLALRSIAGHRPSVAASSVGEHTLSEGR